jgi:hypothetical protein
MQVVAFETEIENDVIHIPKEYCGKIHNVVTVTICEFTQIEDNPWKSMLNSMKNARKVENFKIYSKNEINDR